MMSGGKPADVNRESRRSYLSSAESTAEVWDAAFDMENRGAHNGLHPS